MTQKLGAAALIVATGIAVAGEYVLDQPGLRERAAIAALGTTQIPLAQAIELAEQHVDGRAAKAELESARDHVVAHVKVVTTDRSLYDVQVDANDGRIVASRLVRKEDNE
jgi:uncharacterized membrane protein YkoI